METIDGMWIMKGCRRTDRDCLHSPEELLELILKGQGLEITDKVDAAFECNCSQERVSRVLYSIGKEELDSMIDDGEPIEVKCHFCNEAYQFSLDELKAIRAEI